MFLPFPIYCFPTAVLTNLNPQNGQHATFMLLQNITRQVLIIKYKSTTEKICKLRINKKVLSTEHAY